MPNLTEEDFPELDQSNPEAGKLFDEIAATGFGLAGTPGSAEHALDAVEAFKVAGFDVFVDYEQNADMGNHANAAAVHANISRLQTAAEYASKVMAAVAASPNLRHELSRILGLPSDRAPHVPPAPPTAEQEARRATIQEILDSRFSHVPYRFAHTMFGEDDGGFASMYDSNTSEPYEGRFSNQIGGRMLEVVASLVGWETFVERSESLFDPELMSEPSLSVNEDPDKSEREAIGEETARLTIEHLVTVYPGIDADGTISAYHDDLAEFFEEYVRENREHNKIWSDGPKM